MSHLNWFIARRYFFAKQSNRFISWVGGISILGIALGVIALIITMAVLNGFELEVTGRITNFVPHLIVEDAGNIDTYRKLMPATADIYYCIERKSIIEVNDEQSVLNIRAVGRDSWDHMLREQSLGSGEAGRLRSLGNELPGIVIGAGIADELFLTVGDTITIKSPLDVRQGLFRVPQRHFVITGVFKSEIFDFDRSLAFIPYLEGRRLFKAAGRTSIHFYFKDYQYADAARQQILEKYPDVEVETWYDQNKTLFDAMSMEKWGSFIGLNLIILVAVFNIVSSLMMMVLEKTGSIGILRVMGASSVNIRKIFNLQGLLVAVLGVVLGTMIGTLLVLGQAEWSWITLPSDIYLIPVLPVKLVWSEVLIVAVVAFIIVLLAIRYPSNKASHLKPLDAINYKR